jgi:hypothetical protein
MLIEEQVRAKAVVVRDLRGLRERKREVDRATQEMEVGGLPTAPQSLQNTQEMNAGQGESSAAVQQTVDTVKVEEAREVVAQIENPPLLPKPEVEDLGLGQMSAAAEKKKIAEITQAARVEQVQVKPAPAAEESVEAPANIQPPEPQQAQPDMSQAPTITPEAQQAEAKHPEAQQADTTPPEAQQAGENDDMNFDNLFGPSDDHNDHPDLDFDDFDFGPSNGGNDQNQNDFEETDVQMDLSTFGDPAHQQYGNDDVSSMLQGLESYANQAPDDGEDVGMLDAGGDAGDLAGGEGDVMEDVQGGADDDYGMSGADLDLAMGMGNETSFDDLLDGMDFGDEGGEGKGMQEDKFGDAFFGIGE